MKKRAMLTFAAAGAVVMTTAASYAVWDVTNVTKEVSITTGKGITVDSEELTFANGILSGSSTGKKEIESDLIITVDGARTGKKLKFTTTDMTLGGVTNPNAVVVKIMEEGVEVPVTGDGVVLERNTYKVKVSLPTDATSADYESKEITFKLNADLIDSQQP